MNKQSSTFIKRQILKYMKKQSINYWLIPFLILTLAQISNTAVLEITLNNLKNVLSSYESVYVLFHNPQCIHSRKYVETFLKTNTQQKLGVVDCLRQLQLCKKYNMSYFPVLAKINKQNNTEIIDQQQFLVENKLKGQNQQEAILNRFIRYVESQDSYAIVVFQQYGLPTVQSQRISETKEKIFYLQPSSQANPSTFTKALTHLVNNQPGCWIFKKNAHSFQKYYCGSGYNKGNTMTYINQFKQGKLKKFIFSQQKVNSDQNQGNSLNAATLYQFLERFNKSHENFCTVIYFSSNSCPSCSSKDISNVQRVLKQLNLHGQIFFNKFNIDKNQIPAFLVKKGLKRVPQLMYMCNGKIKVFGQIFFLKNIEDFFNKNHLQSTQETIIQDQVKQQFNQTVQTEF